MLVGPGDDCAVVDAHPLAISCDLSVESVHFRREWLTAEDIGWRAAAGSLSDLAAMAARPVAVLAALAVSDVDSRSGWAGRVVAGVREAAASCGAALVGGDLVRTPREATIDVVVAGVVDSAVTRGGARPGDEVWVTGELGGAARAVALLKSGREVPDSLARSFARPVPRTREASWLAENAELHALIDISDGLAGDAGHLAAASRVALYVVAAEVPRAGVGQGGDAIHMASLEDVLGGGEDYELCIAAAPGALGPVAAAFFDLFGVPLTQVGGVHPGEGVWLEEDGQPPRRLDGTGFDHFGTEGPADEEESGTP